MRLKIALAGLALLAAACGGEVVNIAPTTTVAETMAPTDEMDTADGMNDMDMGQMNMGDANATPAAAAGGELVSGTFRVLGGAPVGFDQLVGTADMSRHDAGTTVTIDFANLLPGIDYVAHVHAGSCFDEGGAHYQFDVGGSEMPPNEIHLAFTSLADGTGFMTAINHQVAGPDATSVVIHERTEDAPKIACADLG